MGRKSIFIVASLVTVFTLRSIAQSGTSTFEFIENKGQWESVVKYRGELPAGAFYLQSRGFTVLQHNHQDLVKYHQMSHRGSGLRSDKGRNENEDKVQGEKVVLRSHAYRVSFEGGNEQSIIIPDKPLSSYNNYLFGNDPSKWQKNVKIFQALTYKNVYPNIDVRYYSENGKLKYDFIVHPGGDVQRIAMKYDGATKLNIRNKELIIKTTVGDVKELYPYTFQFDPTKGRKEVECNYVLVNGNTVKFRVANYDKNATLIIDPSLFFSSFTGSPVNEYGFSATPGPGGVLYSAGVCDAQGYPVTAGAFQTTFGGGDGSHRWDISITKFSANGGARLFGTYLGGTGDEYPHSIISDPGGNLVVMGRTYSPNFPGTSVGPRGLADIMVTKLNSTGTGLIGSLIIGGSGIDGVNIQDEQEDGASLGARSTLRFYGDDSRSEVNLDPAGNIYVAAQTKSGNFPLTGAFQPTLGGLQDGVVMKINPNCNAVLFSSYFGGSGDDAAIVIDINPANGNIYIGGATNSPNLPGDKTGVIQGAFAGNDCDGFVSIIDPNGAGIIKTTYLGTAQIDAVYGVKFDRNGFPYVMGITRGTWPVTAGVWSNPGGKQFVAKLRPDLSGYVFSTVFGTNAAFPNISPVAFLVDRCENMYISGWGGYMVANTQDHYGLSGTAGLPITPDAIKSTTDNTDLYFIVISKNAQSLLYGTFFGQDGGLGEHVDGGTSRFDEQGVIYQAVCANCFGASQSPVTNPFPTTGGVIGPVNGTGNSGCNLAAIKIGFNFAGVAAGPKAFFNGVPDSIACVPATFNFRDTVLNAKSYIWDFGDGSPPVTTTTAQTNHTYNAIGNYRIRLIAVDSTTCNIRDTAYVNVSVRDDRANLAFNPVKLPPCESLSYRFDNLSTAPPAKPFGATSFTWDFGDGTRVVSGSGAVTHSYAAAGTYRVKLILNDTGYCNSPDSLTTEIRIAPLVKAQFETPPSGCAPYDAVFNNTSLAGQSFFWDFGDGNTSTQVNPVHTYTNIGTYTIRLRAVDSATCNIVDSTSQTITVHPLPVAEFSYSPVTPVPNTPTIFTNLSTGGIRYVWLFGDGDSTIKTTMDTVKHQYNATGQYNACLIVYNQFGCTDTVCYPVQAEVNPLLDVPNAFTPGRFGTNSTVRVQGFGIARMTWRIYNRWGQRVFEATDYRSGWDGTFKGQPQPMDVYAYTLDVEFTDGTKTRKTGDITLIR